MKSAVRVEWEEHYRERARAHSLQNAYITADFAALLPEIGEIRQALETARTILEIGCGTGEFSAWLAAEFGGQVLGIDLSETAIAIARQRWGKLARFEARSFEDMQKPYNMVFSSNTLEHFTDYDRVLHKWLNLASQALVITPYRETSSLEPGRSEGGVCHAARLDGKALGEFRLVEAFVFKTPGWREGKRPRQWAALVEEK